MPTWICTGGTLLATGDRAIPVERLLPGAMLAAVEGAALVVVSVGRMRLSVPELAARPALWPVRLAAGALADGVPAADTTVLPQQILAIPGLPSMAARWLVDGAALQQGEPTAPLDVYSMELDGDGTPAGGHCVRGGVAPDARPDDRALREVRAHLAARAGLLPGALLGSIDAVDAAGLEAWADDGSGRPVMLELVIDGVVSLPLLANRRRDDLAAAGFGDGRRGFLVAFDPPLDPRRSHLVRVCRALDGADLPGSPVLRDIAAGVAPLLDATAGVAMAGGIAAAARSVAARIPGTAY